MENKESEEPQRKRSQPDSASTDNSKPVDAAVLQHQNHQLVQQLEEQKHQLHALGAKLKALRDKQISYDAVLISVNRLWNQLTDILIILGLRAGAGDIALKSLDQIDHFRGSIPSCPPEQIFLCRLLQTDGIEGDGSIEDIREALSRRRASTMELLKALEDAIEAQRTKAENIIQSLHGKASAEDPLVLSCKIDDLMKEEVGNMHQVIDALHSKHEEYIDTIETCVENNSAHLSEIKHLAGELEESMAEMEESTRKLVNLKMQKERASGMHVPASVGTNGTASPEKPADRAKRLRIIRESIEETKVLAEDRLAELQDAQEDNQILLKQLQDLQNELKDDKYVLSSRPYTLMNDQLQHWNTEAEKYRVMSDSLQSDRSFIMRKEKEIVMKAESVETARKMVDNSQSKIEDLEYQLQKAIAEKNEVEIKVEEALQDSGRKDIKAEFQTMSSALSKEMGMMEAQLNRWKETAQEAHSLHSEVQSMKALLDKMTSEEKNLADMFRQQMDVIKSSKANIEKMQKEQQELQLYVDMLAEHIYDNRDITEIKGSEQRAHAQAEILRNALEEHGLELRVKAAKEVEVACEQRLAAAEAEIADLRGEIDASDRKVLELQEAIKVKEAESEAYISEIETIGQAYEDMQMQNQRLLKQVTERDDYNIKLVSESVKAKQAQSVLLSDKQALGKQLQRINATLESLKERTAQGEDQLKVYINEALSYIQEDRHLAAKVEISKWELSDAEKEVKWLKSALVVSEKENEQIERKKAELLMELENERNSRKKIQEEIAEWNKTIAEMTSESEEAETQRLQEEIKECKAVLKCGVCFDRPKEVVIVKCYHLFCNPCIQRNLEIRHRKCPACGTGFGQNDVRFVKI